MSTFRSLGNPLVGGIFLSLFAILLELHDIPLEIAGGLDLYSSSGNPLFFIILGIIGGSFISSTFAQEFGIKIPTKIEIFKAVVAGILMGIGSTLAFGGNIGGFYTATANFSASGLTMFLGLIIG
ncbi:MAG: YeeE/YedE family protein, partial [Thermodesulfobacterium sp.]|nr:YeeE/YedE family protein [Thermodesulfobacterium sp.]